MVQTNLFCSGTKLVDAFLMPHVLGLPSYIRDTTDLLKHIKGIQIPPDALHLAINIEALYSSIPHEQGIRMAESFLTEQDQSISLNNFI